MLYKNKNSRTAVPGYTLVPKGEYYQVRKIGLTAKKVRTHPAFKNTRKRAEYMATAAGFGKLIRNAFLEGTGITQRPGMLNGVLIKILETGQFNDMGRKIFLGADFSPLHNFQFNPALSIEQTTSLPFQAMVVASQQQVRVTVPPFVPVNEIESMSTYTHCRIVFIAVEIDLQAMTATTQTKRTILIPWKKIQIAQQELVFKIQGKTAGLHMLAVRIDWYASIGKSKQLVKRPVPCPMTMINIFRTG
jgi:hypothetical protein